MSLIAFEEWVVEFVFIFGNSVRIHIGFVSLMNV